MSKEYDEVEWSLLVVTIVVIIFMIGMAFIEIRRGDVVSKVEVSREHIEGHSEQYYRPVIIGKTTTLVGATRWVEEHDEVTYEVTYEDGSTRRVKYNE